MSKTFDFPYTMMGSTCPSCGAARESIDGRSLRAAGGEMSDPLKVECPFCLAPNGEPCYEMFRQRRDGATLYVSSARVRTAFHAARLRAAEREEKEKSK